MYIYVHIYIESICLYICIYIYVWPNKTSAPLAQASSAQSFSRWPKEETSSAEAWPANMAILARTLHDGTMRPTRCWNEGKFTNFFQECPLFPVI
jgi:hypothetical protein